MKEVVTYHEVWTLARLAGYNLVVTSDSFYGVCDSNFKTLVKCNTLKGAMWYINNMQFLSLAQTS